MDLSISLLLLNDDLLGLDDRDHTVRITAELDGFCFGVELDEVELAIPSGVGDDLHGFYYTAFLEDCKCFFIGILWARLYTISGIFPRTSATTKNTLATARHTQDKASENTRRLRAMKPFFQERCFLRFLFMLLLYRIFEGLQVFFSE